MTGEIARESWRENLWSHVKFLADPSLGGRIPMSKGGNAARDYITRQFKILGLFPLFDGQRSYWQEITRNGATHGINVGGVLPGTGEDVVVVGAHYDHLAGIPGADDNAAAVAELLAAAKIISGLPKADQSPVIFLAFDCEEPPYFYSDLMGSTFFANHAPIPLQHVKLAIISDLVGHLVPIAGLEQGLFILGAENSSGLYQLAMQSTEGDGENKLKVFCTRNDRVGDLSDHHIFRLRQRPFLFLTCGRWDHYHSPSDRLEVLDRTKMEAITEYLVSVIQNARKIPQFRFDMCGGQFLKHEAEGLTRVLGQSAAIREEDVEGIIASFLDRL